MNHSKMAWEWRKPHNKGLYDLGKSPVGIATHRWKNIKLGLQKVG
jgi:hypothetical protein